MLGANIYLYTQVDVLKGEISKLRESIATEVTELRQNSSATSAGHRKSIDTLKSELADARRAAAAAARKAKSEAEKFADKKASELVAGEKPQAQPGTRLITEKKDKGINEPIHFYVAKAGRQPYEIVVNEVKNKFIKGYLATPKDQIARN